MSHFELQTAEMELQPMAEAYWQKAGERERELEAEAYEAGAAIREGELTLGNLESIVRWKSERMVHYLIGNSEAKIRKALAVAADPETPLKESMDALTALRGVDISIASAVLATMYPERYSILDFRTLQALGHSRHNADFYSEYNEFCKRLAEKGLVTPQPELPGPTPLHALERALWEWARKNPA